MSDEMRLNELYRHVYEGSSSTNGDEIHHQLKDALDCLMNVSGELDDPTRAVACSSITSAIRRFTERNEFPTYLYFSETFPSMIRQDRISVLQRTIPQLLQVSSATESTWWFIDSAIEHGLYALLHITFIEDAIIANDPSVRAIGVYALLELPILYWDSAHQHERRAQLIERAQADDNELVRQIITNHSN